MSITRFMNADKSAGPVASLRLALPNLLFCLVVFNALRLFRYAMWRDELQAFMLAGARRAQLDRRIGREPRSDDSWAKPSLSDRPAAWRRRGELAAAAPPDRCLLHHRARSTPHRPIRGDLLRHHSVPSALVLYRVPRHFGIRVHRVCRLGVDVANHGLPARPVAWLWIVLLAINVTGGLTTLAAGLLPYSQSWNAANWLTRHRLEMPFLSASTTLPPRGWRPISGARSTIRIASASAPISNGARGGS